MAAIIKRFNHTTVLVNNKEVNQDMENRWVCKYGELTPSEREDLMRFLHQEHLNPNNRLN